MSRSEVWLAHLPKWTARAMLALILILTVLPARPHPILFIPGERGWGQPQSQFSDEIVYKKIVADMENGKGYYQSAAFWHRFFHYPTAPAQVFREPTLALILTALQFPSLRLALMFALYGAILFFFYRETVAREKSLLRRMAAVAILVSGLSIVGLRDAIYWHEVWAALLVALSLLLYRPDRWLPSVMLGLLACLIREITAPFLLVMALFALWQGRRRELTAWLVAGALFAAFMAIHLELASRLHQPGDIISSGWLGFGGWDFVIATAKWNIFLHSLPYPLIALAICLGVLGLAASPDDRARRATAIVSGYIAAFLVVGRPDNYYWGVLYAPLLAAGLLFAPSALNDLLTSAFPHWKRKEQNYGNR